MQLASKIPDMSVQLWSSALLKGKQFTLHMYGQVTTVMYVLRCMGSHCLAMSSGVFSSHCAKEVFES